MRYYITPKDYEKAKEIGISENLLYTRVYFQNWSIDRAVSTPPKKYRHLEKYMKLAERNGINKSTFYKRVYRGMDAKEAAKTKVIKNNKKRLDEMRVNAQRETRKYPTWVYNNLDKYNINRSTFWKRVNEYGWDLEKASTTPPLKRGQRLKSNENHTWRKQDESRYQEYVSKHKNKVCNKQMA